MARFPLSEPQVAQLAESVASGLESHAEDFPSPPVSPSRLRSALADYQAALAEAVQAAAIAKLKTAAKEKALAELVQLTKTDLRYAENHTRSDHNKLIALGWGGRRARVPTEPPGEVRLLQMLQELPTGVVLGWTRPADGGRVAAYRIQRRRRDSGDWLDVGSSIKTRLAIEGQDPGVEFEYRVIAFNRAGEGRPSNVARAVL
jgi:hypothetical protein